MYCSARCREKAYRRNVAARERLDRENAKASKSKPKPRPAEEPKTSRSLEECVRIAREHGMTYGKAAKAGLF